MEAGLDPDVPDRQSIDPPRRSIALHAEELAVSRRSRTTLVRVATGTETRNEAVEAELRQDDVVVERVAVGRVVDAVPPVRRDGDVLVLPVVVEELVVTRRLVLREEVRVRRVRTVRRHAETVPLRRQVATETRTVLDPTPATPIPINPAKDEHPMNDQTLPNPETIVAAFDTGEQAEIVANDLRAAGVPPDAISIHATTLTPSGSAAAAVPARPKGFWASVFGGEPDHDTAVYDRSLDRGATVLSVQVPQNFAPRAIEIIERHAPIDIDADGTGHGSDYRLPSSGPSRPAAALADGPAVETDRTDALALSEEDLAVGKRVVNRGGARIRRFVVETPVERDVTLRDERVVVERHPVSGDRPVAAGDFTDRSIEMTETAEEAVVSKTARVYEEVALRREAADRTETVRDVLRREEAEVERLPGDDRSASTPIGPAPAKP
ncbi:MAG: YsnF/AvaK domain-containing protein [Gluconacetobacter diazotrophicus]|nr:YsnF/AvaK domain-containing protein [Gluconacetobacter diazotrophicus]